MRAIAEMSLWDHIGLWAATFYCAWAADWLIRTIKEHR